MGEAQAVIWLDNSFNNFKISWKNGYLRPCVLRGFLKTGGWKR